MFARFHGRPRPGQLSAKALTCVNCRNCPGCDNDLMNLNAETTVARAVDGRTPGTNAVSFQNKRLNWEWKTMEAMIKIHCRDRHGSSTTLCGECQGLLDYASVRLERCRFGEEKPTCAQCPVHCYQKARREQVKVVMRRAGPRMVLEHPIMSIRHWLDGFRKAPEV